MATRTDHDAHLRRAIALASSAREHGNHPFGSLLVDATGVVLLEAENTVVTERDATGHAELNLVRRASALHDFDTLSFCTLYTSTEPCAMCTGAIYWSGIGQVVYALGGDQLAAIVGDVDGTGMLALSCREVLARGDRPVAVDGPHLFTEAAAAHDGFWA
ncbi:MAG: nucleoside deaminase [Actinobacteria bacterium]|nr:nucleoside deaminase [Actinomycetota bacterium]